MPVLSVVLFIGYIHTGSTQTYLWPTNASKHLSSSFAEWRDGHFHAGIDIKTSGKIGFPVYAVRSGYIWRMKISPYGYGKVIYQKLDTNEIVVYAHLSRFYEPLEIYAKIEQKIRGQYSINNYFEPDEFPVEMGQIIAYTGESGIGSPHLHFEIRDSDNHPFNPLQKGYVVQDTRKPVVTAVALTPIEIGSQINGQFVPVILKPLHIGNSRYKIPEPIQISGTIGFAVKAYDRMNNSINKLGIYKLKFYLNENLVYSAEYHKFNYAKTNQIFLDRDYGLMRRNHGIFYKLYKDFGNELDFYGSLPEGSGLVNKQVLSKYSKLNEHHPNYMHFFNNAKGSEAVNPASSLANEEAILPGLHQFRIELSDYFNNLTEVTGTLLLHDKFKFQPVIIVDESGTAHLESLGNITSEELNNIIVTVSYDHGKSWNRLLHWRKPRNNSNNEALASNQIHSFKIRELVKLPRSASSTLILKAVAEDTNGIRSFPFFKVLKVLQKPLSKKSWIKLTKDFYHNWIIFNLNASVPLEDIPVMTIHPEGKEVIELDLIQIDLLDYIGIYELDPKHSSRIDIEIYAQDIASRGIFYEEFFNVYPILPETNSFIVSDDGQCHFYFPLNSVYNPLFFRIEEVPDPVEKDTNQVGTIYRAYPYDEPLKKRMQVSIVYPDGYPMPEKLAIYMRGHSDDRWRFANNQWDPKKRTISAKVNELDEYALIRDIEPPTIKSIIPYNGSHLRNKRPLLQVYIQDDLSGFDSDKHLILKLDDEKVIAAYDPEKKRLSYQPDEPLTKGKHQIQIIAFDRSGNMSSKQSIFWIR